jgi:2-polyprenyl-3-methyl-5-hydroxy-6-metoxy-1,4-benzoquinol methylase
MAANNTDNIYLCPVCKTKVTQTIPYLNTLFPDNAELNDLSIAVCGNCGLGAILPEKPWQAMEDFYNRSYRQSGSLFQISARPVFSKYSVSERALSQWMLINIFSSLKHGDSFCDIGPGSGSTFQTARLLNLNLKMFAFEPDKHSFEYLKDAGVSVYRAAFNPDIQLPSQKFKVIIMSHVLEHFSGKEAIAVLKKIKEMLLDDGLFFCEVPNMPLSSFKEGRVNDAPHFSFWSQEALKQGLVMSGLDPVFLNSAGEKYQDWLKRSSAQWLPSEKKNLKIKDMVKRLCPVRLRKHLSFFKNNIFSRKTVYNLLSSNEFAYGPERIYLRAICFKNKRSEA